MNKERNLRLFSIVITCVAVLLFTHKVGAGGFQARGILDIKTLDREGKITSDLGEVFEVSVDNCKWRINTAPYPESEKEIIASWEIGSDGDGAIYQVSTYKKSKMAPNSINDSVGLMEKGSVPENLQGNNSAELWLAFASSCYFQDITNEMLRPVYQLPDPSLRAQGYLDRAIYQRFDSEPKLPKSVRYMNDKLCGLLNGKAAFFSLPPPFDNGGFTRADYEVVLSTNIDNKTLPIRFTFTENTIARSKDDAKLFSFRTIDGVVTNFEITSGVGVFKPALTKATYVDDRRLDAGKKPVATMSYMVTNEIWPETNSDFIQGLYKHELVAHANIVSTNIVAASIDLERITKRRNIIIALLLIPSLVFLFFMLKFKRGENGNATKIETPK